MAAKKVKVDSNEGSAPEQDHFFRALCEESENWHPKYTAVRTVGLSHIYEDDYWLNTFEGKPRDYDDQEDLKPKEGEEDEENQIASTQLPSASEVLERLNIAREEVEEQPQPVEDDQWMDQYYDPEKQLAENRLADLHRFLPQEEAAPGSIRSKRSQQRKKKRKTRMDFHSKMYRRVLRLTYYTFSLLYNLQKPRSKPPEGRPLRVLRIASLASQGGVAKVLIQTIIKMDPQKVENHLLIYGEKKVPIRALQQRPDIPVTFRRLQLWPCSYEWRFFRHVWKLARMIRRIKPDLIHVHEPQHAPTVRMALALAGRRPIILHLHSDYRDRTNSIKPELRDLHLHALRRCHLVACSRLMYDAAKSWLGEDRCRVELIEDGVNDVPDCPPSEKLRSDLETAANGRFIVSKMARITPLKRIGDFLLACRLLLDEGYPLFVVLMSYGRIKRAKQICLEFQKMFAPHEGEFMFKVQAPQNLLDKCHVGVTCSSLEGLGLNVLEYQFQGVPVVCTDIPAHREMVEDEETGLFFPVRHVEMLYEKMKMLLEAPEMREHIGKRGRECALQRRWEDTAENTIAFYRGEVFTSL